MDFLPVLIIAMTRMCFAMQPADQVLAQWWSRYSVFLRPWVKSTTTKASKHTHQMKDPEDRGRKLLDTIVVTVIVSLF